MFTSKKQIIDFYKEKLQTNKQWAIKGLAVIYNYQSEIEQESKDAKFHNGMGFTALDAGILSSFHEQYEKRKSLSEKQFTALFKMMPKYAGQLVNHSLAIGKLKKDGKEYKFM